MEDAIPASKSSPKQEAVTLQMDADFGAVRSRILELPYLSSIRPSTLLAYLVCCAPPQLPAPYEGPGKNLGGYLDSLTTPQETKPKNGFDHPPTHHSSPLFTTTVKSLFALDWRTVPGEVEAWESIQSCLDVFVQRLSVADVHQKQQMRSWYEGLLEIGGHFHGTI